MSQRARARIEKQTARCLSAISHLRNMVVSESYHLTDADCDAIRVALGAEVAEIQREAKKAEPAFSLPKPQPIQGGSTE